MNFNYINNNIENNIYSFNNFKLKYKENFYKVIQNKINAYQKIKKIQNQILKPKFENKKIEKIYDILSDKHSKIKENKKYNIKNFKRILKENDKLIENEIEYQKNNLIEFFMKKIKHLREKNIIKNNVPLFKTKPKPFKFNVSKSSKCIFNSYSNNNIINKSNSNQTNCTVTNENIIYDNYRNKLINDENKLMNNNINLRKKNINIYNPLNYINNIYYNYNNNSNFINYNKSSWNIKFRNIINTINNTSKDSIELQKKIISFEKIKKSLSIDDIKKNNICDTNDSYKNNNNNNDNLPKI